MLLRYSIAALASACWALAEDDTESTSTLTIQSFVTVVASPPTTSASATSSNGLGDYIMQGLSDSDKSSSTAQVLPAPVSAPFPSDNATSAADWQACQTSQISWSDAWSSAYQPEVVTRTRTNTLNYYTLTYNVTLGNSDVYTTIDGIPHAHEVLEPTSTSQFVEVYSEIAYRTTTYTTKLETTFTNPTPDCKIAPSKCTTLWEAYLEEHNMPTTFENATEPAITPVPTDRPRCSVGDVTFICQPTPTPSCVLIASKVDLYYWPSVTAAPNASLATANSSEVVTQVVGNITMTSPSVYLVFDRLQAMSSTDLDPTCSLSSPLGATGTLAMAGGGAIRTVGGPYTNAVVSLDATGLSSLVRDLGPVNTASVVSEIAHGGPSYSHWINAVRGTGFNYGTGYYSSVMAKSVEYANFMVPNAEAYYMNINGAPGCDRLGDHPQCSTIYDGAYKAQLLVPKEVRTLRPEWAECIDPLFGALDPPIALTQVASIKVPELPSEPASGTPPKETPSSDPSEQTTPAVPGHTVPADSRPTSPPPKGSPTALPETNPDDQPNTQDASKPGDKPVGDDKPSNHGKPSHDENPSNDDKPNDNGHDSSEPPTQGENSEEKPQNDATGSSPSDDQDAVKGGDSDKKPEDALDVLTAAQHSEEAKATASPGTGNTGHSGNGGSTNSGTSDDGNGASGTAGGSSNGDSGAAQGQDSGGNSDGDESNVDQTSTSDESSGVDDSSGKGSDAKGSAEQVVEIDGKTHTIAAQNGVAAIDGTPLPTDGSPITIDGKSVGAVDGAVVIGTQTVDLAGDQTANSQAAVFTANGQAFTAVPGSSSGAAVVDGTTLSVGGQAVTAHGATISAASNGVVADGSTIGYEDAGSTASPAVLTFGSNVVTASAVGSDVFAIGTVTLTAGGSDATISGHTVSAASSGIVVDGSSSSTDARETQSSQATQSTSIDQAGQSSVAGSEASKLHDMHWAVLLGSGLLLLL